MMLKWPWQQNKSADRLAMSILDERFVYAQADTQGRLQRCGSIDRGEDSAAAFVERVRALSLTARNACAVLAMSEAQLLEVDAPAVRPEELKAAARWKVKDMVSGRVEDLTMDVMFVGDDQPRPNRRVFVAMARNTSIQELAARSKAAGLDLSVIDLVETAQRNLQSAQAAAQGLGGRATAALVRHGAQGLLTVCAGGELYYARRIEWDSTETSDTPQALQTDVDAAAAEPVEDLSLEGVDFIDYGAEETQAVADTAARWVVEVQRSLDLWERSWPDLPLAALWVHAGEASKAVASTLQPQVVLPVEVLDLEHVFPGLMQMAPSATLREALLPVLGALLRQETLKL